MNQLDVIQDWLSYKENRDKLPTYRLTQDELNMMNHFAIIYSFYRDEEGSELDHVYILNNDLFRIILK